MADERVRESDRNPPLPADFADAAGTPIAITPDGGAWVLVAGNRVVRIGEGMSMEQEVATTGLYRGKVAELVTIFGARSNGWASSSTFGDLAEYLDTSQANLNNVSTATQYYAVSTSAADSTAGAGVDRLRIVYLDANGYEQIGTVTLNGTTPVTIPFVMSYVQYMETEHSTQPDRYAQGNISITSLNGAATTATTVERIVAGGNRSLTFHWKCPVDCEAFLIRGRAFAISNTMDVRLRAKIWANDGLSNAFHFLSRAFLTAGSNSSPIFNYLRIPPTAELKVSAIPGGTPAGNKLDASLNLIKVKLT